MAIIQDGYPIEDFEDNSLILAIRFAIGDYTEPYKYSDEVLQKMIAYAATYVKSELCLDYTVDLTTYTITPVQTGIIAELIALKTCIMLAAGQKSLSANNSISISDGPSSINLGGQYKSWADLYKDFLDAYNKLIFQYKTNPCANGGTSGIGFSITGPYTFENRFQYGR